MVHDFSKAEVGDYISFKYEGAISEVVKDDRGDLYITTGSTVINKNSTQFTKLVITKPLPSTPGSVILCTTLDDEPVTPFTLQLRSYDEWCDADDQDYYDITDFTVLHDAGEAKP